MQFRYGAEKGLSGKNNWVSAKATAKFAISPLVQYSRARLKVILALPHKDYLKMEMTLNCQAIISLRASATF